MLGERHLRVRLSPGPDGAPDDEVGDSMLRVILKWVALAYLIVESLGLISSCLELALKLTESHGSLTPGSSSALGFDVALHFVIVVLILSTYLCLRKVARLPPGLTRQSALLTARAARSAMLACLAICAFAAETIPGQVVMPVAFAWILFASPFETVILVFFLRTKFLSVATKDLLRDPNDVTALRQWWKFTVVSMTLAMSVGVCGFMLRLDEYSRALERSFFAIAVGLLSIWRPRLNDPTISGETALQANGDAG
jgi:hypothetical protein